LRDNILDFYSGSSKPVVSGEDAAHEQAVLANLSRLKSADLGEPESPKP
jgi:hypothetical protein